MIPHFYLHPGTFDYDFGPHHPLKPERLRRTIALLEHFARPTITPCDPATDADLERVHTPDYIQAVKDGSLGTLAPTERMTFGFWGDNPPFAGMEEAARAYVGASVAAARAVVEGARLAFGIGGGLHHALSAKASGFCIYNDCAIACSILRDRFSRVAYVDIDVHHGDGVQWIFYDDPTVLTCSIHESGRSLWPGTGGVEETGAEFTSVNVPIEAGATADVWLWAFENGIMPALDAWQPEAIVLQIGADTHYLDPLAHVNSDQQHWLAAIQQINQLGLPTVVLGGGGYDMTTVPRMWASAVLSLSGIEFPNDIPPELAKKVGSRTFDDPPGSIGRNAGRDHAEHVVAHLRTHSFPNLGASSG